MFIYLFGKIWIYLFIMIIIIIIIIIIIWNENGSRFCLFKIRFYNKKEKKMAFFIPLYSTN